MPNLPDPKDEARRLNADPGHLRRKADYIESMIQPGTSLEASRRYRVSELRDQADRLEGGKK